MRLLLGVCRGPIPADIYSVQVAHSSFAGSHESNARFSFLDAMQHCVSMLCRAFAVLESAFPQGPACA